MKSLEVIVGEALDVDPSEWPSFLDNVCRDDDELRARAESLLAMHVKYPSLLQPVRPDVAPTGALGAYQIVRELGRGGMGVVYEADDPKLERRVALKLLPRRLARDARWRRQFEREAQILASLRHPHIAEVYTLEEADGLHFLTMELIPAQSLADRLSARALSPQEALQTCAQVASALEAVHRKGVVHCDLKPSNVLLAPGLVVKVIDFGLARREWKRRHGPEPAAGRSGTREAEGADGTITGTPGYMAPEQLDGRPADHLSDIWAFGCLLFECLSGSPAFAGRTRSERLAATRQNDPDWSRLSESTSDRLRALLQRCLAKSPSDRSADIASARLLLEEEAALAAPASVRSREDAPPHNLPTPVGSFVGRAVESRRVEALLEQTRLVTLSGPAGSGKNPTGRGGSVATASGLRGRRVVGGHVTGGR